MEKPVLKSAQNDNIDQGRLQINVTANVGLIPIQNASITISYTGEPDSAIETLTTDSSGQTESVTRLHSNTASRPIRPCLIRNIP